MRTSFAIEFIVILFGIIECQRNSVGQNGQYGGERGQLGSQGGRFGGQGQNENSFGGQNRPFEGRGRGVQNGVQGGRGGPRIDRGGSGRNEFTPENILRKLNQTEVFVSRYIDRAITYSTAINLSDVQILQDIKANDIPQFFNTLRQKLAPFVNITATPAPVTPLPVINTN